MDLWVGWGEEHHTVVIMVDNRMVQEISFLIIVDNRAVREMSFPHQHSWAGCLSWKLGCCFAWNFLHSFALSGPASSRIINSTNHETSKKNDISKVHCKSWDFPSESDHVAVGMASQFRGFPLPQMLQCCHLVRRSSLQGHSPPV